MTLRAIALGLVFGVGISIFTYFNDHVIQQTFLIGNHFPVAVFAPLLLLLMLVNPLMNALKLKVFRPIEIALIAALGLAVCGWPGSSFFRSFSALVTAPANMLKTETNWQANHVLSYLPGASSLLGEGHVNDWNSLSKRLADASLDSTPSPVRRVWEFLPERSRAAVLSCVQTGNIEQAEKIDIVNSLNQIIGSSEFYSAQAFTSLNLPRELSSGLAQSAQLTDHQRERLNRDLLVRIFPTEIRSPPQGRGYLLADGDVQNPAFQGLLQGAHGKKVTLGQIPWKTWWPSLVFWGGLALLMGLASVCMVVIVQPQWKRELLAFPIAKFVQEISQPGPKGGLPAMFSSRLFWYGFVLVFVIHLINGLQVWFPEFIKIPLMINSSAIGNLFPYAKNHLWSYMVFSPTIVPTIIGFSFFLSSQVSFSLGVSGILFLALFGFANANSIPFGFTFLGGSHGNMLRFGAYIGSALMIFFVGRHYYLRVIAKSLGLLRQGDDVPRNAVWGTRLLVVSMAASAALLVHNGLDVVLSLALVSTILLLMLIMTRINVETGAFFIQPLWVPVGVITVLFGTQAIGPTGYVIMVLASTVLVGDPREIIMPFIANGMYLATPTEEKKAPTRVALLITTMVVVGFVVALCATLYFQYNKGLNVRDTFVTKYLPKYPFDEAASKISELSAYNELAHSVTLANFQRFASASPDWQYLNWAVFGLVLVLATSLLRIGFAWWPLHPVCFLVWGTNPGMFFAASFLLGWFIKTAVVKMSGSKGYRTVKPFMVGLIGGELMAAVTWAIIGIIYYSITGLVPLSYKVFP